ncbi:gamma-glutamyltransferase [Ornithinimicrobium sp. F0845]|uniref:gamma-glutamyltransferase family protein n=1 Tax=Ornithinimicrobium sp. F0845 TaxID=2926412 RepID=UPI001FF46615|nr:gamma-glutamyltransferase [Ornithinimicrobium sp. F0845]MCK0114054.1 gamma-glutamyltransferase [Ornithinimicrobium sp. F0845]
MAWRHRSIVASVLAALLVLTACSGDDDPVVSTDAPTETTSPPAVATSTPSPTESLPADPTDETSTPTESPEETTTTPPEDAFGDYGVAAGHPRAVQVGMEVLEDGGNAVDAAVATAFSMAVLEPLTSGPGGGGATLVVAPPGSSVAGHPAEPVAYDYREVVQSSGQVPDSSTGIPGFVAGMAQIHAEHGQLSWQRVLRPAIRQAEEGVPISWFVAQEMRTDAGRAATAPLPQFHLDNGDLLSEGDVLFQPELADTLRDIAGDPRDFYEGDLAAQLSEVDGIDAEGLATYQVDVREPPRGAVGDYEVLAAAPALSGVGLIQLLQVAEAAGVADTEPGSAAHIDTLTDAWVVAEDSIETVLGDPNFVDVPVDQLTDPQANATLAESEAVGVAGAARGTQVPGILAGRPAPGNTTHLSVVDADGLAVSMSNTITSFWGSRVVVGGFFVNNHLIRFGSTGRTDANEPEAGKRPVSYMTPAVLLDAQQRPVLVIGSPGGMRIPNIQAAVISRWALHDQDLQTAVDASRTHLADGVLQVEGLPAATVDELTSMEYAVTPVPLSWNLFGSVQALELDHEAGLLTGATDERRTGAWDSALAASDQRP